MKSIIFTRSDFEQVFTLKKMYLSIDNILNEIPIFNELFKTFKKDYYLLLEKLCQCFSELNSQIKMTNKDITYFVDDIALLGLKCFDIIDSLGKLLDFNMEILQLFKYFKNINSDAFFDEDSLFF